MTSLSHHKHFKGEDGSWVSINVTYAPARHGTGRVRPWCVLLMTRKTGRHKWTYPEHHSSYVRRQQSTQEQWNADLEHALTLVTKEEIQETIDELWAKIKPGDEDLTVIPNPEPYTRGY
jgi:hypothetical protein